MTCKPLIPVLITLPLLAALSAPSQAQTIVNIDAAATGCVNWVNCNGSPHLAAGQYVGDLINPVQLTLPAGTYTITNANGLPGANPNFTAWRFNGGDNWVWAFEMIDDATKTMVVQGCCVAQVYGSQAAAAADPFAVNYSATFTLAQTTTLDFITEDYAPGDNAGGMALAISPVPEPATTGLMLAGLAGIGGWLRRRR
jgi:hypothetical protein